MKLINRYFMRTDIRIISIVTGVLFLYVFFFLAKFQFNPSATVEFSLNYIKVLPDSIPDNLIIQTELNGYDGQFFYALAVTPIEQNPRVSVEWYKRLLYPLSAKFLSFGRVSLVPFSLLAINIFSVIGGTFILLRLLKYYGSAPNLAFVYAFNVGFVICVIRNLTDIYMFFWVIVALYCREKNKNLLGVLFFICALLTKEGALLVVGPLVLYEFLTREFKRAGYYLLPILIYGIWLVFVGMKFTEVPLVNILSALRLPFSEVIEYFKWVRLPNNLREFSVYFSILPVFLFALVNLWIIVKYWTSRMGVYTFLLIVQIICIFSLNMEIYGAEIDALGRYAIGLYLFSILSSAEKKINYHFVLIVLMVFMSLGYATNKLIFFNPKYIVTG